LNFQEESMQFVCLPLLANEVGSRVFILIVDLPETQVPLMLEREVGAARHDASQVAEHPRVRFFVQHGPISIFVREVAGTQVVFADHN
jgi:hypothetical protein